MMRGETEEVQRRIKAAIQKRYGAENTDTRFRFFDTIAVPLKIVRMLWK